MKIRSAKTIWLGLLCVGVLGYLLLLGQVNIRQFQSKLTGHYQNNLLHLAQASQRHCGDLLALLSEQLRHTADQLYLFQDDFDLAQAGAGLKAFSLDAGMFSLARTDAQGTVIEHFGDRYSPEAFSHQTLLDDYRRARSPLDEVTVTIEDASTSPELVMVYPLSQEAAPQGALVLQLSLEALLKRLDHKQTDRDMSTTLISGQGKILSAQQSDDGAFVFWSICPQQASARFLLADIDHRRGGVGMFQCGRHAQGTPRHFLAGHWPLEAVQSPWSIAVIQDDHAIQAAVADHARSIQLGMVCLFWAVFLIWLLFYRSAQRGTIQEQQTALGRATDELQDLSEQHRVTCQEHERQTALYRSLLDAVPMGLYWKDAQGRMIGLNREYARMTGCEGTDAQAVPEQTDLLEQQQAGVPLDMEVMNKGIELLFLPQTYSPGGRLSHYLVSKIPVKDDKGTVSGLLGSILEEERIKATQKRRICTFLRSDCAAETLSIPLLMVDRLGVVQHANGAFWKRFNAPPPSEIQKLDQLLGPDIAKVFERYIRDFSETVTVEAKHFHVRCRQGWFWVTAQPVHAEGRLKGVLLLLADLPEHKQTDSTIENSAPPAALPTETPLQNRPDNQETNPMPQHDTPARILIVDDVQENVMLLEIILSRLGYTAVKCSGGRQAVSLCGQESFDLILMDIQMPDLNGLEATRQIRADSLNSGIPIIAMTASDQKDDEFAAMDAGCDGYLTKPINRKQLEQKIWRSLAKKRQIEKAENGCDITSFLDGDPDYYKTIETFVSNLPGRIDEMRDALNKQNLEDLAFKAHALKGLGGFAGFAVYTDKAARLEQTIREQDIDKIQAQIDEMVQLCVRTKINTDKQ